MNNKHAQQKPTYLQVCLSMQRKPKNPLKLSKTSFLIEVICPHPQYWPHRILTYWYVLFFSVVLIQQLNLNTIVQVREIYHLEGHKAVVLNPFQVFSVPKTFSLMTSFQFLATFISSSPHSIHLTSCNILHKRYWLNLYTWIFYSLDWWPCYKHCSLSLQAFYDETFFCFSLISSKAHDL